MPKDYSLIPQAPTQKSRGGMRYRLCTVDDHSNKTWTHFAPSKNHIIIFVKDLVNTIQCLDLKVRFLPYDSVGEHKTKLQEFCKVNFIVLIYTAPNTPKQNGRAEKKIHIIGQRVMMQMVNANLTINSQNDFGDESVVCTNFLEDLMIKHNQIQLALTN